MKRGFILIVCFIFMINFVSAENHYVSPTGSASWNSCTNINTPCSLATANSNAVAGNTIHLRAGIYQIAIKPSNSGIPNNYITYKAYNNEIVIITGVPTGLDLTGGEDYIKVVDIIFRDATYRNVNAASNTGLILDGITSECPTNSPSYYVNYFYNIDNSEIFNSNFSCKDLTTSGDSLIGVQHDTFHIRYSDHIFIHDNTFGYGSHNSLQLYLGNTYVVIKNNLFNNPVRHGLVVYPGNIPILVEGNTFDKVGWDGNNNPYNGGAGHHVSSLRFYGNTYGIIRRNIFDRCDSPIMLREVNNDHENSYIFHNTIYDTKRWTSDPTSSTNGQAISSYPEYPPYAFKNNVIINNIISLIEREYFIEVNNGGGDPEPSDNIIENNIFYDEDTGNDVSRPWFNDDKFINVYWGDLNGARTPTYLDTIDSEWIDNIDNINPNLINPANDDFTLQSNSPAIDTARALTTTTNSNTGTNLEVVDANFFFDGWLIQGAIADTIYIEDTGAVLIDSINYNTNVITLSESKTWTSGKKVYQCPEGVCFSGSASDIGAFEYPGDVTETCINQGYNCCDLCQSEAEDYPSLSGTCSSGQVCCERCSIQYFSTEQYIEAEEGIINSPIQIGNDINASRGQYIYVPEGIGSSTSPTSEAVYSIDIPFTGEYYLWLLMYGPTSSNDALYIGFNGDFDRVYPSEIGKYEWVRAETVQGSGEFAHTLIFGINEIQLSHGEELARADVIFITNDPSIVPQTPTQSSACNSPSDANSDGSVSITELINYITQWKAGDVTITELIAGIGEWKNGC